MADGDGVAYAPSGLPGEAPYVVWVDRGVEGWTAHPADSADGAARLYLALLQNGAMGDVVITRVLGFRGTVVEPGAATGGAPS